MSFSILSATASAVVRAALAPTSWGALAVCLLLSPIANPALADPVSETAAAKQILLDTWHTPQKPLDVDPVIVVGEYGLAGWTQEQLGGIALLRRSATGDWHVVLCGGADVSKAEALTLAGVPPHVARHLSASFAAAANKLTSERRAQFDTFGTTVHFSSHAKGHGH